MVGGLCKSVSFFFAAAAALLFLFRAFGGVSDASVDERTGAFAAQENDEPALAPGAKSQLASHDSLEAATRALEQAQKLSACGFVAGAPFTTSREFLARSRARGRQTERPKRFSFFSQPRHAAPPRRAPLTV